jgi:hypothetical protein
MITDDALVVVLVVAEELAGIVTDDALVVVLVVAEELAGIVTDDALVVVLVVDAVATVLFAPLDMTVG